MIKSKILGGKSNLDYLGEQNVNKKVIQKRKTETEETLSQ